MPGTWRDMARELGVSGSPHDEIAIEAGAYYMAKLRWTWRRDRTPLERNELAQASYNAGVGNVLRAQKFCGNAKLWHTVRACLPLATGAVHARETRTYVERIGRWWREMELAQ